MGNQGQQNMYPMHGLQQSASQGSFNPASLYNMMQPPRAAPQNMPMADLWYYEDPNVSKVYYNFILIMLV